MPAIASKDQELSQQSQKLQLAKSERDDIMQDFLSTKRNISSSESHISKLQEEKKILEKKLKLREKELEILKESKKSSDEMVSLKQEEIDELNKQLESVKVELKEKKMKLSEYEKKLLEITTNLTKKSEEVEKLQEANDTTKQKLHLERERVDQLIRQQAAALTSELKYRQQTKVKQMTWMLDLTRYYSFKKIIDADWPSWGGSS